MWLTLLNFYFIISNCLIKIDAVKGECGIIGKNGTNFDNRIINGTSVQYLKYPWFASLFLTNSPYGSAICGGSLIHPQYVLTAAHCFKSYFDNVKAGTMKFEDIYVVKLGITNRCVNESTQTIFPVIKVFINEEYFNNLLYYDISIMKLEKPAQFMPICLPDGRYESVNRTQNVTIIGLGNIQQPSSVYPCILQEANVSVYNDTICRNILDRNDNSGSRLIGAFCAGLLEGGIDTCQGDSGGPLQAKMKNSNNYMILGITSFGYGCALKGFPGIYTDASHYLDWIYKIIGNSTKIK